MKDFKGKRYVIFILQLIVIGVLVFVDGITKKAAEAGLADGDITLIKNVLSFAYVRNTGAAFGSMAGRTTLLSIITGAVILAGLAALFTGKIRGKFVNACAVMILAGGIGNLIDRCVRHYVVDFIRFDFIDFPVFNFADILVTCGVFMCIGWLIYDIYRDMKKGEANGEDNG